MALTKTHNELTPAELQNLSVQGLRAELARSIDLTVHSIARLGAIWRELEARGEDLSDLRTGLAAYLPLVAAGKLHPEAVVRYAGHTMLLRYISRLPTERQVAMARGERIAVVDDTDGSQHKVQVDEIPAKLLPSVFGVEGLRSVAEQRRLRQVRMEARTDRTKPRRGRPLAVRVDTDRDVLRMGKAEARLADVLAALRQAGLLT